VHLTQTASGVATLPGMEPRHFSDCSSPPADQWLQRPSTWENLPKETAVIQSAPQQDIKGLSMCSWDHFEYKSSNTLGSDLQRFVKKMSVLLHL
jgi:hypothetical protein